MEGVLLLCVAAVMVPTLFVAGLHDVPNSIAIPVRTRALTARVAARLAAVFNAIGVLLALPIGLHLFAWFDFPAFDAQLTLIVVFSALATVLGWNIVTYFRGMPTSTTHVLLAGLLGGALAAAIFSDVGSAEILALPWLTPLMILLVSPLVAFGTAYLMVFLAVRLARGEDTEDVNRFSRVAQSLTVGLTSLGTGLQQGQRFLLVLLIALGAAGVSDPSAWLPAASVVMALVIGAGCLNGGWRIGHVLGHRLVAIDPLRGMVSTTTTSGLLFIGSLLLSLPLSTSLTAASAIIGSGSNQRFATVNFRQFRRIVGYWAATPVVGVLGGAAVTALLAAVLV
ncbi:inorganic phosphate transporter [Nesterenkonia alba]|uniref:inorganic phosphate transporter n=1 Tax=Nesterenkonia alba TaxID=515814 RepID=UPI0003B761B5|nr:inorganic phosphate transporter [Nesterenkonia alba]